MATNRTLRPIIAVNFDIRTLSLITAVSSLVFAFSSFVLARLLPRQRYLRDWALGAILTAVSTFLVGMRGLIPDMVSAAVANTLLTMGLTFMLLGARGTVGQPPPGRGIWLFSAVAFFVLSWFILVQPDLSARIVVVSLVLTPLLLMTGLAFWRHDRASGPTPLRMVHRFTCLVYLSGAALFVARVYPALQSAGVSSYVSSPSALLVAPYFWAILFNVWLAVMVTLTASARLQAELASARDLAEANSLAKSQFLANMSHEIRTPMNAILGMLKLLQGTELSAQQQDYASKTEGAAHSLLGLLNDILDFSKVEAGKMTLDMQAFSVERMLRELSVVLSANVGDKNVQVLFDVDPACPPMLVGDALRLQQILINLGGNAVKFTQQGQVVLSLRLAGVHEAVASVEFAVQDTGIGISAENQGHIFSGFSQAEASTTRRFGGTGLGLAISQRLVGLMGGALRLHSVLGQGSTFAFSLDLPVATSPAPDAVSTPTPCSVLIVDGNPVAANIVAAMARSWNWTAQTAASGEQAIAMVREQSAPGRFAFQVMLLDWRLQGMDVWKTMQEIQLLSSRHGGQAPAVILLAPYNHAALAQCPAQVHGFLHGVLVKPFTASMLREVVLQPPEHEPSPRRVAPASKPRRLEGVRLLVVEDNRINQQVAQELLRSEGAQVVLAANGQLGVDAVASAETPFDAVLMDIQMPVLDGYGATRLIRQQLGLMALPIIAMTANAMPSDRDACLAAGMVDHIGKPFDLAHLIALLQQHVKRSASSPPHLGAMPPAMDAVDAAAPLLDLDAALVRMAGAKALYVRVAREYLSSLPQTVPEFRRLAQVDAKQVALHLHSLKGTSDTVGAVRLAQAARRLEVLCQTPAGLAQALEQSALLEDLVQRTQSSLVLAVESLDAPPGS